MQSTEEVEGYPLLVQLAHKELAGLVQGHLFHTVLPSEHLQEQSIIITPVEPSGLLTYWGVTRVLCGPKAAFFKVYYHYHMVMETSFCLWKGNIFPVTS